MDEDLEQYLDWDEDEGLILVTSSEEADDEFIAPIDELVEEIIQQGRDAGDYRYLYCVAHELNRNESLVRRAAEMMEDDVAGFFDLDPEDLQ
jgi:hypothetical protein